MRRMLAGLVFLFVACVPPTMTPEQKAEKCGPRPTIEAAQIAVKGWVEHGDLKDPFSAQTRNIEVQGMGGIKNGIIHGGEWQFGWIISFEVNAKNSYGAYVGWRTRYLIWNNGRYWWMNSVTGDDPTPPARL